MKRFPELAKATAAFNKTQPKKDQIETVIDWFDMCDDVALATFAIGGMPIEARIWGDVPNRSGVLQLDVLFDEWLELPTDPAQLDALNNAGAIVWHAFGRVRGVSVTLYLAGVNAKVLSSAIGDLAASFVEVVRLASPKRKAKPKAKRRKAA